MNRRGFFGWTAAAIGWLCGVKPAPTIAEQAKAFNGNVNDKWDIQAIDVEYPVLVTTEHADGSWSVHYEIRCKQINRNECKFLGTA